MRDGETVTDYRQSQKELDDKFEEQLDLLAMLAESYDLGKTRFAIPMATCLRVLLYDTNKQISLATLAQKWPALFVDTAEVITNVPGTIRAGSYSGLVGVFLGADGDFIPHLDRGPTNPPRMRPFIDYWNESIHDDLNGNSLSRKELILWVANKDGGAHVDQELPQKFVEITRRNSLGWVKDDGAGWEDISVAHLASIRQIAHEILKTYRPTYLPPTQIQNDGYIIGAGGMMLVLAETASNAQTFTNTGRNDPCPCGSGKKFKRCHGALPRKL